MPSLKILVTGAAGNIGRFVVDELLRRGHSVLATDRRHAAGCKTRFVLADLRHREQVQPMIDGVDAVAHLGEIPGMLRTMSPEEVLFDNVRTGSTVLQTASDLKIPRVVYISSCQVYGFAFSFPGIGSGRPVHMPMDETHPFQIHNPYALGKVTIEQYAKMLAARDGFSIACFRFPATYIHEPASEFWQAQMNHDKPRDGLGIYLHAADAARAVALSLENPRPGYEPYHFTANRVLGKKPLRDYIAQYHPDYPPLPSDWPDFKSPLLLDKARNHFGWEPQFDAMDRVDPR